MQSLRGFRDLYDADFAKMEFIKYCATEYFESYGYSGIELPLLEHTEIFSRSLGEVSDVVNKEMYTFLDRNNESITLRPEGTASYARAFIANNMEAPKKHFYIGPMFRYERPQKGRYRQFFQIGVENIGHLHPFADAETIYLGYQIIASLGLENYELSLNTLGDLSDRQNFNQKLIDYLSAYKNDLSEDSQKRLLKNPLRILDSKDPSDKKITQGAPKLFDALSLESKIYYDQVKNYLAGYGVAFKEDERLVRGLDYYTHTAFEFKSSALGAQDTFLGGGRYDGLIKSFGGPDTPAVGWGLGIDRAMLLINDELFSQEIPVVVIPLDDNSISYGAKILEILRADAIRSDMALKNKLQKNFKWAEKVGAAIAILIGENEVINNTVTIKDLKNQGAENKVVSINNLANHLIDFLDI